MQPLRQSFVLISLLCAAGLSCGSAQSNSANDESVASTTQSTTTVPEATTTTLFKTAAGLECYRDVFEEAAYEVGFGTEPEVYPTAEEAAEAWWAEGPGRGRNRDDYTAERPPNPDSEPTAYKDEAGNTQILLYTADFTSEHNGWVVGQADICR